MDRPPRHDPRLREHPDPHEQDYPIPYPILLVASLGLAWAAYDIVTSTLRDNHPLLGDRRTLSTLQAQPATATGRVDGAQLYAAQCAACHQASGAGLPGVFPPLAGSEWVAGKDKVLVNIVLHGVGGSLTVKGVTYNGAMPEFKDKLDDQQLAAVLNHVRSFDNNLAPISPALVAAERAAGKERLQPWDGDNELSTIK